MTPQEWIISANNRIADAKEVIETMHRTSSREAFWSSVKNNAEQAKNTIAFLEEGKRLIMGLCPKDNAMTTAIENVHQTSFGMYVPCDKETYKKLKKIYHLYSQFVKVWADRWGRSQYRIPDNRKFSLKKFTHVVRVTDSWVFPEFWNTEKYTYAYFTGYSKHYHTVMRTVPTELLNQFFEDYQSARRPVASPEEVKPLKLSVAQIDKLLSDITQWLEKFKA